MLVHVAPLAGSTDCLGHRLFVGHPPGHHQVLRGQRRLPAGRPLRASLGRYHHPIPPPSSTTVLEFKPLLLVVVVYFVATMNMNGTALYEAVACIFMAQALGVELSFGQVR